MLAANRTVTSESRYAGNRPTGLPSRHSSTFRLEDGRQASGATDSSRKKEEQDSGI